MAAIPARAALASGLPSMPPAPPPSSANRPPAPTAKELAEQPRLLVQASQQLGQHAWVLQLPAAGLAQPRHVDPVLLGSLLQELAELGAPQGPCG
jgi:hypothetical protein